MSEPTAVTDEGHVLVRDRPALSYPRLFRRFVLVSVICSVIPLLLIGWATHLYYFRFSMSRAADYFQRKVDYNQKTVQTFLQERVSDLKLLGFTHSLGFLTDSSNLRQAFDMLNQDGYYFTDLGVLDEAGKHMAYIGPHDLMDKDYSKTFWFKGLMAQGLYVSDMFMGYRETPHFIIAILCSKGPTPWILRATVDNEFLSSLIETTRLGETGEVFLVNHDGYYQTAPRFTGKIMDKAPLPMKSMVAENGLGLLDTALPVDSLIPLNAIGLLDLIKYSFVHPSSQQVVGYSLLKSPEWLLIVKQDFSEVFGDLARVNKAILILLHSSIIAILIISVFTARHMINAIRKWDEKAQVLNRQLMQASKLASIGELAAGVAHEINNPLAIILTESQVMRDMTEDEQNLDNNFKEQVVQSLGRVDSQVQRCSHITQNLLRFSRKVNAASQFVDLNLAVRNVVGLLEKCATTRGIKISIDCGETLPRVYVDPFELEQVFLNLINNAIDAHEGKQDGTIRVSTRFDCTRNGLLATVTDSGSGIPSEILERVFDPFFTTKTVGKGNGLGLSISYSIMQHMGGSISVHSEMGTGAEFTLFLPCMPSEQNDAMRGLRKEGSDENAQDALSRR